MNKTRKDQEPKRGRVHGKIAEEPETIDRVEVVAATEVAS